LLVLWDDWVVISLQADLRGKVAEVERVVELLVSRCFFSFQQKMEESKVHIDDILMTF